MKSNTKLTNTQRRTILFNNVNTDSKGTIVNYLPLLWAMEPNAFNELIMYVRAFNAGPVDDAARSGLPVQIVGKTAIIPIVGPMIKRSFFGLASTVHIKQAIDAAKLDSAIDTIVLRIDSPGGSVDGLAELGDTVYQARKVKPVLTQVEGQMHSAALYVGSQGTEIYAGRNDLIGSIGTRLMLYDYSEAFRKEGIRPIPIDTGEHKSTGAIGTVITESQQSELRRIVDRYFQDFKMVLSRGRRLSSQKIQTMADGRMFFADEAMELGLIDKIQTLDVTMKKLAVMTTSQARARMRLL